MHAETVPCLDVASAEVAPDNQAAATATVLAVANGSRALGLALHAYVFEEAAAHGVLNAPAVLGAVFAAVALAIAFAMPPPPTAWRLQPTGEPDEADRQNHRDD